MTPAATIAAVLLILLAGGFGWLLARRQGKADRAAAAAAVKQSEAEVRADRAEIEKYEAAKSGDEVWETFKEWTDEPPSQ